MKRHVSKDWENYVYGQYQKKRISTEVNGKFMRYLIPFLLGGVFIFTLLLYISKRG